MNKEAVDAVALGFTRSEFEISHSGNIPTVCDRGESDVGVGKEAALAIWRDDCGSGYPLGYRVNIQMTIR